MMRGLGCISLATLLSGAAFAQSPKFEVADVHASAHTRNPIMQGGYLRGGRYELRTANMVDLIRTAYNIEADNVVGGPSWLESDRFDVIAKAPPSTSPEAMKLMLQALLADRFKLVVHKDTRPMPAFVLSAGKGKPKMKEAVGSGNTSGNTLGNSGCELQPPAPPGPGGLPPTNVAFCRSVTMAAFASMLRSLANAYITSPAVDSTGLKGSWDFDLKWTSKALLQLAGADGITIFEAVDKQLGLKLEPQRVPMPVVVVDSANQKPTPNAPGVITSLPPAPPTEFEVATIRPSLPGAPLAGGGFLPGGRIEFRGMPLRVLITLAWDVNPGEELVGAPKWLELRQPTFDLVAKGFTTPTGPANSPQIERSDLQLMLQALLTDRFKMKTHYEDRPVDAYTLVAAKPKLKKADPANRTGCKTGPAPVQRDAGDFSPPPFLTTCQNITMAQFAEQLQTIAPVYIRYPALDATGIEGAWDFTLTFSPVPPGGAGGGGRSNGQTKSGPAPAAVRGADGIASDPIGGVSLFDALDKQLGLKLELHKRPFPVFVIDHIDEKPTEN